MGNASSRSWAYEFKDGRVQVKPHAPFVLPPGRRLYKGFRHDNFKYFDNPHDDSNNEWEPAARQVVRARRARVSA